MIHGSLTGHGELAGPNEGEIFENLTINGGIGRFEGATGTLRLHRFTDNTTLPAFESHSGTVTGTISIPK